MRLINYSPATVSARQRSDLEALIGRPLEDIRTIPVQAALRPPLEEQITLIVDAAGLSAVEWQTHPLLVILPPSGFVASCLLAEMHGRMGHFPSIVSLGDEQPQVINLQTLRTRHARQRRFDAG